MSFQTHFEVHFCGVSRTVACVSFIRILNCGAGEGKDDGRGKELKDIWGSGREWIQGNKHLCVWSFGIRAPLPQPGFHNGSSTESKQCKTVALWWVLYFVWLKWGWR